MNIKIRIFEGKGNVKEVTILTRKKELTIHNIKQTIQTHMSILGNRLLLTSNNNQTLYDEEDIITEKDENIVILGFAKTQQKPLTFRVSSARARSTVIERIHIDYDYNHH